MKITRGRQIKDEDHPCKCHDSYVECEDEETVHIKRDYFEHIVWFWCRNCECHWNKVTYLVGKHAWIELVQDPYVEEEEEEDRCICKEDYNNPLCQECY